MPLEPDHESVEQNDREEDTRVFVKFSKPATYADGGVKCH